MAACNYRNACSVNKKLYRWYNLKFNLVHKLKNYIFYTMLIYSTPSTRGHAI